MITVYSARADDYSGLGLCALMPTECTVKETVRGAFLLEMTHPMDNTGRWWNLLKYNIIKAPCPVRETPKINMADGAAPGTTITRKVYAVRVNSRLRLRTKPSTSTGKIIGRYENGVEVLQIGVSGDWFEVIVKKGGATGWMHSDYLRYVRDETQVVPGNDTPGKTIEPRETREQLFRILGIQRDDAAQMVYVTAWHKSYDMMGWTVKGEYSPKDAPAKDVLAELVTRSKANDDYSFYCTVAGNVTGEFRGRGLISAILENDGIAAQTNARVVRDNFDIFLLEDETRDRGVQIRHGKNMTGAIMTEDVANVITRVIPVGKNKDGKSLYLDGIQWVECPNAAEIPLVSEKEIQYDVKVGDKGFETVAKARAELRRLAELEFSENGLNAEIVGLDVDFEILENTQPYTVLENYAALQAVSLYDIVSVISARSGIKAKLRVTGYVYDCIRRRYKEVILGELHELDTGISGYDISGGVSGSKIIYGSMDGDRIRDLTIQYAKIARATIEQLQADAIAALRAHIHELVAGTITTDELYADLAKIVQLEAAKAMFDYANIKDLDVGVINALVGKFGEIASKKLVTDTLYTAFAEIINLSAENLEADRLSAALGNFVSMYAGTGEFDFATIENLVAKAMTLVQGSMGTIYIKNLAVTSASLLSATLGKLIVKNDANGKYYRIFVDADGQIRTQEVEATEDTENPGYTEDGTPIVEKTINAEVLNGAMINAESGVINSILTEALNTNKLTATDALIASATITELYTASIQAIGNGLDLSANKSINLLVGKTGRIFRSEEPPEGAKTNDLWIQPSTGYVFQNTGNEDALPEFATDDAGNIYYRYTDGQEAYDLYMDENGDLYLSADAKFGATVNSDGVLSVWARVKDSDLTKAEVRVQDDAIISTVTSSQEYRATSDLATDAANGVADLEEELGSVVKNQRVELETQVKQLVDEIGLHVREDELETYLKVLIEGVRIGRSDSLYNVLVTNTGVNIRYDEDVVASFVKRQLTSPSVRIANPADHKQSRCVMRVAADGGMMIVNEEAIV